MLAALKRPRKHYKRYYCTRSADNDMRHCSQGLKAFLRAYFHYKSADWVGNDPYPLRSWTAQELAKMPGYYIMDLDLGMAETVSPYMPSDEESAACSWLTEEDLQVYVQEFSRTGFQGGLQWYRCSFSNEQLMELRLFSGRTIDVPSCFIGGTKDWGVYQLPGAFVKMQGSICTQMVSCDLVAGSGHWVQQEQPEEVVKLLKDFLSYHP
jgi:pimeloyl-ACP methyl ester carboxylesterase